MNHAPDPTSINRSGTVGAIPRDSFVLTMGLFLAPPLLWALHFAAIYLTHTLVCVMTDGKSGGTALVMIGVATVLCALPILLLIIRPQSLRKHQQDTRVFIRAAVQGLAVLSFIAVIWGGITALVVPACMGAGS